MDAALYLAHPYHKPTIGWLNEMEQLSREDAITFYRSHYTPGNAVLVVAGDVTADEVKKLVEEHYGSLLNTVEIKPRKRTEEPEPLAARRVTLKDARVAAPMMQRDYLVPSSSTAKGHEADGLDLLAQILGGGSSSRLYKSLVVDAKIAAYAGSWYTSDGLDSGEFGIYAAPNPGGDVAAVETAVDVEIARIVKDGVTEQELARAKAKLAADAAYALDNQAQLARIFGVALTTGSTVDDVQNWQAKMEQATVADVRAAAEKYLDIRRSVTGVLLPEGGGAAANGEQPAMPQMPGETVH
jgi:zinc protease